MDVLKRLEPLSEQHGLLKFLRNEDHAGSLNGFVQDVAQAVTDYQVCYRKGTVRRYLCPFRPLFSKAHTRTPMTSLKLPGTPIKFLGTLTKQPRASPRTRRILL